MSDLKKKKKAADPEQEVQTTPAEDPAQGAAEVSQEELQGTIEDTREQLKDTEQDLLEEFGEKLANANDGTDVLKAAADLLTEGQARAQEIVQQLQPVFSALSESARKAIAAVGQYVENANAAVTAFCNSEYMTQLQEIFPDAAQWIEERSTDSQGLLYLSFYLGLIADNLPAIREYVRANNYTGSLADFLDSRKDPDTGELLPSLFEKCLDEVEAAKSTGGHRVKNLDYPIDKVNSVVWDLLEADTDTHGQMSFKIKAEPNGSKKQVNFLYSINFDNIESEVPIVKRLTPFDKRAYIAVGGLWKAGNDSITISQIYHAMGYRGTPGKSDREKINQSMTKFHAIIHLSNAEELAAGYKYPSHVYDGPLLPFYRDTTQSRVNGQLIDAKYYITLKSKEEQLPLIEFAAQRSQITTIPLKMLQGPVSKTNTNLEIEDYLIERIAAAKSGRQPDKILLSTLYEHANIKTYKQKERAPKSIKDMLDYYVQCGEIEGYTMDKTSITLSVKKIPKKHS